MPDTLRLMSAPQMAADTAATSDTVAGHGVPLFLRDAAPATDTSLPAADTLLRLVPGAEPTPITRFEDPDDVRLPFFTLREVALPEAPGVTGSPLPYSFRNDDYITGALLLCFFLVAWVMSGSWRYFHLGLKSLFRPRPNTIDSAERTDTELRGQLFLVLQTAFAFSILYYDYLHVGCPDVPLPASPYLTLGVTTGLVLACVTVKTMVYKLVNNVFFDRVQREQWMAAYLFSILAMGLLILPVALLVVYFDLAFQKQLIAFFCIFGTTKIFLFYRCFRTFFAYRGGWMHLILYFCTLEIVPALMLWRVLFWANTNLTAFL